MALGVAVEARSSRWLNAGGVATNDMRVQGHSRPQPYMLVG